MTNTKFYPSTDASDLLESFKSGGADVVDKEIRTAVRDFYISRGVLERSVAPYISSVMAHRKELTKLLKEIAQWETDLYANVDKALCKLRESSCE